MQYYKVGRIYWIKPSRTCGFNVSKERPALLLKHHNGRLLFLQICSTEQAGSANQAVLKILDHYISNVITENKKSYVAVDISKPEWESVVIKAHCEKRYIDVKYVDVKAINKIYEARLIELEALRLRKARGYALLGWTTKASRELCLLKQIKPFKYRNLDIELKVKAFRI